jgi:uncharacterized membrane protein
MKLRLVKIIHLGVRLHDFEVVYMTIAEILILVILGSIVTMGIGATFSKRFAKWMNSSVFSNDKRQKDSSTQSQGGNKE